MAVDEDQDVLCRGCGDPYRRHEDQGGACRARDGGRCPCLGFRWVDPTPAPGENTGYPRLTVGVSRRSSA